MSEQWEPDFMPVEELEARTGLTWRQINNDIRNGLFPGRIVKSRPFVARRHYERWIEGDLVLDVRPPSPSFVHKVESSKLLGYGEEVD